jgi:hypothetical protein
MASKPEDLGVAKPQKVNDSLTTRHIEQQSSDLLRTLTTTHIQQKIGIVTPTKKPGSAGAPPSGDGGAQQQGSGDKK